MNQVFTDKNHGVKQARHILARIKISTKLAALACVHFVVLKMAYQPH